MITKKLVVHAFMKKALLVGGSHWSKSSRVVEGDAQCKLQVLNHHDHRFHAMGQWRKIWLQLSDSKLQRTYIVSVCCMIPIRASLSFVFSLHRSASHVNISMRCGTRPRHIPLIRSIRQFVSIFASSLTKDLTENDPFLWGVQIV